MEPSSAQPVSTCGAEPQQPQEDLCWGHLKSHGHLSLGQVAPSPVQPDFGHCQEWIPPHHPSFPKPLDSDGMGVVLSGTAKCSYCNLWVWWGFVLFLLNWIVKIPLSQDSLWLWGCAISNICTAFAVFSIPWDEGWDSNLAPTRAHSQACAWKCLVGWDLH